MRKIDESLKKLDEILKDPRFDEWRNDPEWDFDPEDLSEQSFGLEDLMPDELAQQLRQHIWDSVLG